LPSLKLLWYWEPEKKTQGDNSRKIGGILVKLKLSSPINIKACNRIYKQKAGLPFNIQ
jgi:hypothetical protein